MDPYYFAKLDQHPQIRITLMRSRNRIRIHIRIKLKSLIRTCINLMQIATLQHYMAFVLGFFNLKMHQGIGKKVTEILSDSYPAFFLLIATTSNKNF